MRKRIVALSVIFLLLAGFTVYADVRFVGSLDLNYGSTTSRYVVQSGSYAYFFDGLNSLFVVDVSNPNSPVLVGSLQLPGSPGIEIPLV
jgi:hypothetical protein